MEHPCTVCPNCFQPLGDEGVCGHCGFEANGYVTLPHHLAPGARIKQRYQVGRVLGEGGFGITYAGRDTVLNLKIAIKEFYMAGYVNRNHEASPDVFATLGTHRDTFHKNKEKFLSEARVLARFYEEPGIVGVRDFCEENGTAYIIMDFLDGVTLKDYLEKNGRLAPAEGFEAVGADSKRMFHRGFLLLSVCPGPRIPGPGWPPPHTPPPAGPERPSSPPGWRGYGHSLH